MMTGNLQKGEATGKLELANKSSPVTYQIAVADRQNNGSFPVTVSVSAPRDWLLKQGFKTDAVLIRQDGARIDLHHDGDLDVGDAVSVELIAHDDSCADEIALQKTYPELRI